MEQAISGYHKVLVGRRGIQVKLILFSPNKQIVKKEFGELGLYGKDDPNRNVVVCGHPPQERHIKI